LRRPPPPEELDLNPETTVLQVLTEFHAPPRPEIRKIVRKRADENDDRPARGDREDQLLDFGDLLFPPGQAFLFENSQLADLTVPAKVGPGVAGASADDLLVTKEWLQEAGRSILVESAEYTDLAPKAPLTSSGGASQPGRVWELGWKA
jgi:hypothetical protein